MIEVQAPKPLTKEKNSKAIFLAGSIDMGKAIDWQKQIKEYCKDENVTFFNPRRDDFDPELKQDINNPPFREQVEWELNALDASDIIVFFFDPKGKAPITLMELGIHTNSKDKKLIVCCEDGFWRKGNVDIVCKRYNIETVESLDKLCERVKELVNSKKSWKKDIEKTIK